MPVRFSKMDLRFEASHPSLGSDGNPSLFNSAAMRFKLQPALANSNASLMGLNAALCTLSVVLITRPIRSVFGPVQRPTKRTDVDGTPPRTKRSSAPDGRKLLDKGTKMASVTRRAVQRIGVHEPNLARPHGSTKLVQPRTVQLDATLLIPVDVSVPNQWNSVLGRLAHTGIDLRFQRRLIRLDSGGAGVDRREAVQRRLA